MTGAEPASDQHVTNHQHQAQQAPTSINPRSEAAEPELQSRAPPTSHRGARRTPPSASRSEIERAPEQTPGTEPSNISDHAPRRRNSRQSCTNISWIGTHSPRRLGTPKPRQRAALTSRRRDAAAGALQQNRDSGRPKVSSKRRGECRGARASGPLCPCAGSADEPHAKRVHPKRQQGSSNRDAVSRQHQAQQAPTSINPRSKAAEPEPQSRAPPKRHREARRTPP